MAYVALESFEAGNCGGLGPVQLDAEPGQRGRSLESLLPPAGHDAEVGSSPSERPEEVGVLLIRGLNNASIGEDNRHADNGIQGQPVLMRAESEAAVQKVAGDTDAALKSATNLCNGQGRLSREGNLTLGRCHEQWHDGSCCTALKPSDLVWYPAGQWRCCPHQASHYACDPAQPPGGRSPPRSQETHNCVRQISASP